MKRINALFIFILLSCNRNQVVCDEAITESKFGYQIDTYVNNCSLNYYKIRACDGVKTVSLFEHRINAIWDSLSKIYPDSMEFMISIEGNLKRQKFITGERVLNTIPTQFKSIIYGFEIEIEYEIDLGCCNEKICNSYFEFDKDSNLVNVQESDFYLTMPRYSKDFIYNKKGIGN